MNQNDELIFRVKNTGEKIELDGLQTDMRMFAIMSSLRRLGVNNFVAFRRSCWSD